MLSVQAGDSLERGETLSRGAPKSILTTVNHRSVVDGCQAPVCGELPILPKSTIRHTHLRARRGARRLGAPDAGASCADSQSARVQERDGVSTIRSRKVLLETCTYPPFARNLHLPPALTCGRARAAAPRSTLGRTWRFDRPPRLSPAAFGSAYAFGRFSCVGELLSLATSSNSPHTSSVSLARWITLMKTPGALCVLLMVLWTISPSAGFAQAQTKLSAEEKLEQEFNDPLTTLPQVIVRDSYTPANYGPCTPQSCVRNDATNQLIIQPAWSFTVPLFFSRARVFPHLKA